MGSRALAFVATVAVFCVWVSPAAAQEPTYTTLSGGWSWPVDGPVSDTYQPGFTMAASFRTPIGVDYQGGFEVGYTWLSLDSSKLASENPGSTFSGGDMGFLSITAENDYLMGLPTSTVRPLVNMGLGYFRSFADDAIQTTGSEVSKYSTGVYKGSFFGFHAGLGVLIAKERYGIRLDASYQLLFQSGPNLGFIPIRAGIVFYP